MKTGDITVEDLRGVFAVPPLARRRDAARTLNLVENDRIVRHIVDGGITRLLYGGNAFLYHITLADYEQLLDWLAGLADNVWAIPSVGPAFGRALDEARLVGARRFPTAMLLPCNDPRDAVGLARGAEDIAQAAGVPLVLYLKDDQNFGADLEAGLDAVARLVDAGTVISIKYAIVRRDPTIDPYLDGLMARVDRVRIISGMGERPAVTHLRHFGLPGFTTGSGCLAPSLCSAILDAAGRGDWTTAETHRAAFLPLEDLRDAWGPARVLHAAFSTAGVADTGAIPPFVSELEASQASELRRATSSLEQAESLLRRGERV
jgi:dihydrodipicolinate synthase/N-acetylneuraminate lyase